MAATDAAIQSWEIALVCVRKLPNGKYTEDRKVIFYYVRAKSEQEAVDLALSWLPKKYDITSAIAVSPFNSGVRP